MSVLFVGGPWHARIEHMNQLPVIRVPVPFGSPYRDSMPIDDCIVDYLPLEYGTASTTEYYLRFRVYTPKGEVPERTELMDALVQTLYKTDLGKSLGIEKIERLF